MPSPTKASRQERCAGSVATMSRSSRWFFSGRNCATQSSCGGRSEAGQTGGGLTSYLDQVPGTRLKTGQIEITGKYETYGDLKGMMEDLEQAGGFLSQINVRGTAFKLVYRVYGS
jgi:hypothetical protein